MPDNKVRDNRLRARRLALQKTLRKVTDELVDVHYTTDKNIAMKFPCLIYHRVTIKDRYALNRKYTSDLAYDITVITEDPDSDLISKVLELPYTEHDRRYVSDNLYHDVIRIYI